jgi:putative CocE/NonD family hydrolase
MPDGIRIAVDIILPDPVPSGGVPTILVMTRYWRATEGQGPTPLQRLWVSHGYAVVSGDVRGTGASFGRWPHQRSRAETLDYGEVMSWITAQPWSDGKIGGWGTSYTANTADWMVERNHPALKAVVSRSPDYDPYADLYFPGGVPNAYMGSNWGAAVKAMDLNAPRVGADGVPRGVRPVDGPEGRALLDSAIAARRDMPNMYEAMHTIVYKDDGPPAWNGVSMDWWGIHSHAKDVERAATPMQSWASWMDAGTANGVLHRFMTLSNPQNVVIGAWSHGGVDDSDPFNPVDAPTDPPFDQQNLEDLCFFDRFVRGRDNGVRTGTLRYYTMGEGRWKTTTRWPLPNARSERWYLGAGGELSREQPKAGASPAIYDVDFELTTGEHNRWATNNGAGDVVYPDRASDVGRRLAYTSAPLATDLEVTGQPVVTLHLAASRDDAAVFIYLTDVAPDGKATYVGEGQLRALHREVSREAAAYRTVGPYRDFKRARGKPLVPGRPVELRFEIQPVSVLFRAGHRIRVEIAGADKGTFARIPAEGPLSVTVFQDARRPSAIELPVVGRRSR